MNNYFEAGEEGEIELTAVGQRLDKALADAIPSLSRSQWKRLIQEGQVFVDDEPARAKYKISGGEIVTFTMPDVRDVEIVPEDIPLDIRYEDDDLLVVNKPAGMVMTTGTGHYRGTLVNAVLGYCPDVLNVGSERRPGIVHRLDKDTSGLVIVAKTDQALNYMQAQFKERTVHKTYLALVDGQLEPASALIDAPLGRDPRNRKRMSVIFSNATSLKARTAQTRYETVTSYDDFTLVECYPLTGRTHQIRVHLAYIKFPIVGDKVYGRRKQTVRLKRHFLHAAKLTFQRPSDGQPVSLSCELPPELQHIITLLDKQQ